MRPFYLILGLIGFTLASPDGFGHSRNGRQGRRGRPLGRRGRTGDAAAPPAGDYSAGREAPLDSYGAEGALDSYGSGLDERAAAELAALEANIPGIPGEDYPIYSEVPESGFTCDGQVDGGYYADPEAECQVFHICTSDGQGGLAKYSFLCPNGTIFNQNYFICDWWFNFDCAEAADLYSLNDDIAAERAAASGALDSYGAPDDGYGAPTEIIEDRALPSYEEEQASYTGEEGVIAVREGRRLGRRGGRRGGRRQQRPRGSRRFRG